MLYLRNHHNVRRKDARVHVDRVAVPLHVVLEHPGELRDARVRDRRLEARVPARAGRAQRLRRRLGHVPQLRRREQLARARVLRPQLVDEQPARRGVSARTQAGTRRSRDDHTLRGGGVSARTQAERYATLCEHRKRHATLHEMLILCAAGVSVRARRESDMRQCASTGRGTQRSRK